MYQVVTHNSASHYGYTMYAPPAVDYKASSVISCNWQMLREQLLSQWRRLNARELDKVGPNRDRIANLIEYEYGVSAELVANYLRNFERTLPLASVA